MKTPTNVEIIASLNEQIEQWRNGSKRSFSCQAEIERHLAENKLLRHERDEARREVCKSEQYCVDRSREEATRRGWDCFKKENHNA